MQELEKKTKELQEELQNKQEQIQASRSKGLSLSCLPALVSLLTRVCSPELGAEIMMKGPFDEWAET